MKSIAALLSFSVSLVLVSACDSAKDGAAKPGNGAPNQAKNEAGTPPKAPEPESYGGEFCATIIPCFEKLKFSGNFTADVAVDIEEDGSVSAVSYTGDAPVPVQNCITDTIKGMKLETYNGKPGRTRCTQGGQLMGGTQMVSSGMTYEVRKPEAAPAGDPGADAKAEAEAGAPGAEPTPGAEPAAAAEADAKKP